MTATGSSENSPQDRSEFASRKTLAVLGVPVTGSETISFWSETCQTATVRWVRSADVAGKIARQLARFRDWFAEGFGHDRIVAVTSREVTLRRERLAATVVRHLAEGRQQLMAPATVNNHLAHLSAFFNLDCRSRCRPRGDGDVRVGDVLCRTLVTLPDRDCHAS